MMEGSKPTGGKYVSFLFIVLLFFSLALSSLFTVLIGAQTYENINGRMEDNFREQTSLSYISNKVKQADIAGAVSVRMIDDTEALVLEQAYDGIVYETMIYCWDGQLRELFCEKGAGLGLADGVEILPLKGISFTAINDNLIEVSLEDGEGQSMFLGLRSEEKPHE